MVNCTAKSRSWPLTSACTAWRSSRFFDDTRSSSPWICALTPLGPSSRISLLIFLASSEEMPSLRAMEILLTWPDWRGSEASRIFSDWLRLTSLPWKTSRTALARSSAEALISIACSPCHSIEAPVPLKSKRVAISRAAWLRALSTSWRSILLTMSNDESAIGAPIDFCLCGSDAILILASPPAKFHSVGEAWQIARAANGSGL
ncbi:hypothetical protein NOCA2170109 [metagenome]|uniref:Uncharacterized protein n=1 Tax=metagenome TaxID=256318 RepID=A0A2P2BXR0_9ZZZZ